MNKKIIFIVGLILVIGVCLAVFNHYSGAKLFDFIGKKNVESVTDQKNTEQSKEITANVMFDLRDSSDFGTTTHYVVRFFQGSNPVSAPIAIPIDDVVVTIEGDVVIPVLDELNLDDPELADDAVFTARVVEDEKFMTSSVDKNRPPYIGIYAWTGRVCSYNDDQKVEVCDKTNNVQIDWTANDFAVYPTWEEMESVGPQPVAEGVNEFYAYSHTPIEIVDIVE